MRVNEIFQSLQGEGAHTGIPSIFVRFSGCNLQCPFCDTDHSRGVEMTADEIIAEVCRYPAPWIILTGGEPSLAIDATFINELKEKSGKHIAIETNGTTPLPEGIDWVTVSPKDAKVVVDYANEIKVVDCAQPLEPYFALPCYRDDIPMFLQPCHVDDPEQNARNLRSTIERVIANPRWRLSLQTHRLIDIP